jgi:hypothetical protein
LENRVIDRLRKSVVALTRWLMVIPAILLILLGCGQAGIASAKIPSSADTRSRMRADYSPWPFFVVKPLNPAVYEVIQADVGDEMAMASPVAGEFWATVSPTASMSTPTATPAVTATTSPSGVPLASATAMGTASSIPPGTAIPTGTRTPTGQLTATPSASATRTRTPPPTATRTRTLPPPPTSVAGTHYRSIGTNTGTLYSVGNASINQGSTTVTFGGGASLPGNVGVGDRLLIGGESFFVLSRGSATQATVQDAAAYQHSGEAYTITRAYATFQSWETDRQGDLIADNRVEVGVAYDDGTFVAAGNPMLEVDGSITDSTHFMWVTVAPGQGHRGVEGTGVVLDGSNSTQFGFDIKDDHTRVDGLEFVRFSTPTSGPAAVRVKDAFNVLLERLLIHDFHTDGGAVYGIRSSPTGAGSFTVRNSIIYDGKESAIHLNNPLMSVTVENCTVFGIGNWGISVDTAGGTMTVTNTISMNNGSNQTDFEIRGGTMIQSHNLSEDGTAAGDGSLTGRDPFAQFVSTAAGSEDFHLAADSDALEAGIDLSARFTNDVDQDTRPRGGAWNIGADE